MRITMSEAVNRLSNAGETGEGVIDKEKI